MPRVIPTCLMFMVAAWVAILPVDVAIGQGFGDPFAAYQQASDAGDYALAAEEARKVLVMAERANDGATAADANWKLGACMSLLARYDEAEVCYKNAIAYFKSTAGANPSNVASLEGNLAYNLRELGRYDEAESLAKRSLATLERLNGPNHRSVAFILNELGRVHHLERRFSEAEQEFRRAATIRLRELGPDDDDYLDSLNNLGVVYMDMGRYADAEPIFRQVAAVAERVRGKSHPDVALYLQNLATMYVWLGRAAEAEALEKRSLAIREASFGPEHPLVADSLATLALVTRTLERYSEAEKLYLQVLSIREKVFGPTHDSVASALFNLGEACIELGRYEEADAYLRRGGKIIEDTFGPTNGDMWFSLQNLSRSACKRKKYEEALVLADQAREVATKAHLEPFRQSLGEANRALALWNLARRDEAIDGLTRGMDLAEEYRASAIGGEVERAAAFGDYAFIYERMVDWQFELGDAAAAAAAIERGHARALLEEMRLAGIDLDLGLSVEERKALEREESVLSARVQAAETALAAIEEDGMSRDEAERALAAAREAYYAYWRDRRANSPIYQRLLAAEKETFSLDELRRQLTDGDLLLLYMLGDEGGYLVTVSADDSQLARLTLGADEAKSLGVDPGPLTAARLQAALFNDEDTGVLQRLASPDTATEATSQLATLWTVLFPEKAREDIGEGRYKCVIVVPDGPLAMLPFETLVMEPALQGGESKYLLDAGAAISYAPSATILSNLTARAANPRDERMPVLSVADPVYQPNAIITNRPTTQNLGATRYATSGGGLPPLPSSAQESAWLKAIFDPVGLIEGRLLKDSATEAAVRAAVPKRQIVHLACHGLADDEFGNFFGALALTPGPQAAVNPRDDGFLTLPEIYELDMTSCELAILSACQTNYGPRQKGEGTWALSRAFLVAGSRRVVASNWLVDDEAAASLVSYFCGGLATSHKRGEPFDYARSLQAAKLWVRQQPKWSNPYYWATFVLVGPS